MANRAVLALRDVEGKGIAFRARVDNGAEVTLDSGPEREGPSPVEAVLIALGGCTGMDVISILRKKRQEVTGYEVEVLGERREEHPRRFTRIEVVHRLRGRGLDEAAVAHAIQLSDTKYCSVHATLAGSVEITSRFEILPD